MTETLRDILDLRNPLDVREALRNYLYRANPLVGNAPPEALGELTRDAATICLECGTAMGSWERELICASCATATKTCVDCEETFPLAECVACQFCSRDLCTYCRVRCATDHDGCRACHTETCTALWQCES